MLGLPLRSEVIGQDHVEIATSEVAVARSRKHGQLALHEGDDRHCCVHGAHVDKSDNDRLVNRHISLIYAIGESSGRAVVHEAQAVEPRNGSGIKHRVALRIGEVGGHRNDNVSDGGTLVLLSDFLHALEHHAHRTLRGQYDLLIIVLHRDADFAGNVNNLVPHQIELLLNAFRIELFAENCLHTRDRVLEVGGDPGERSLAELALLA
mmetsp:Transcript_69970/g.138709  ORF Transcript_69970/g.138709 Transcript_69970/m.138709 type:complete len:208 (-) Transcript_69970:162-785(-)